MAHAPQDPSTMSAFRTGFRFNQRAFDRFAAPRRPRHRWLRVLLGAVGVGLLLALLFVSVFVGIAMLSAGMLWRLWKQRGKPVAARARSIEGDYRVVGKAQLPLAR
jgi:predicted lipid-binding transport protein (Tim44 family)